MLLEDFGYKAHSSSLRGFLLVRNEKVGCTEKQAKQILSDLNYKMFSNKICGYYQKWQVMKYKYVTVLKYISRYCVLFKASISLKTCYFYSVSFSTQIPVPSTSYISQAD